jgi:16S rRNA (cytidine1402-2'-O)-methyltransferase
MTKTYEETIRGNLEELHQWSLSKEMLGEFTIVIEGFNPASISQSDDDVASLVKRLESSGITRKEAIAMAAKELKISKRKVFDIMIEHK